MSIAIRVVNTHGDTAALAARVSIRPLDQEKWFTFSSDSSWRASTDDNPMWETVVFNDRLWAVGCELWQAWGHRAVGP